MAAKVRRQTFDGYSPLEVLNALKRLKNMDLEKIDQVLNDWSSQTAFVRADARKTSRMAKYAR